MAQWNPWHGCHKISAGCNNCYVYRMDSKFERDASMVTKTSNFELPLKKSRNGTFKLMSGETVYTCFSSDFFVEDADEWRIDAWRMIRLRSDLHFFIITKRIDRFTINLPEDWADGYDNVTICSTCETQDRADYRLPILQNLPIKHKVIICEPLLEHINLSPWLLDSIEEVSVGGESGENARICNFDWVYNIRNQCLEKNIPFQFRQTGERFVKDGRLFHIKRQFQFSQAAKAGLNFRV